MRELFLVGELQNRKVWHGKRIETYLVEQSVRSRGVFNGFVGQLYINGAKCSAYDRHECTDKETGKLMMTLYVSKEA